MFAGDIQVLRRPEDMCADPKLHCKAGGDLLLFLPLTAKIASSGRIIKGGGQNRRLQYVLDIRYHNII